MWSSAKIITDRQTGQPRGFGFVEMETKLEGQKAISMLNGRQVEGRVLAVNEARPQARGPAAVAVAAAAAGAAVAATAVVVVVGAAAVAAATGKPQAPPRAALIQLPHAGRVHEALPVFL